MHFPATLASPAGHLSLASADKARLYIYRAATIYGSEVWTAVSLDRARFGDSAPGTVFYRDVALSAQPDA